MSALKKIAMALVPVAIGLLIYNKVPQVAKLLGNPNK